MQALKLSDFCVSLFFKKEEGEALIHEVRGQIMIKRIPSRMKSVAHEKLRWRVYDPVDQA